MKEDEEIEVTYTYWLPRHAFEKKLTDMAPQLYSCLTHIDEKCRQFLKNTDEEDHWLILNEIRNHIGLVVGDLL